MTDTTTIDHSELSPIALRVKALESLLVEKGYVDPAALDVLIDTYETKIGPRNGAKVVAKAWTDPAYRPGSQEDATAAIASWATPAARANTWWRCTTRQKFTTWWSAPSAPVIPGRCWACRPSGTSRRLTARAPLSIRAASSPNSA